MTPEIPRDLKDAKESTMRRSRKALQSQHTGPKADTLGMLKKQRPVHLELMELERERWGMKCK